MIIRQNDSSLLLITQPDHAALASRIMRGWTAGGFPESTRRDELLAAVEAHDNGWGEVDGTPLVDPSTGRLLDFMTLPIEARQGVWPRGIERLREAPYQAALVAAHAIYVYDRYRGHPDWASFFEGMQSARDRHLAAAGRTPDDLQHDYPILRLGDLLSLTFCNAWREPQADAFGYQIRCDGVRLSVTPDPFGGADVPLEITARQMPNRPFASAADVERAWRAAPTVLLTGVAAER